MLEVQKGVPKVPLIDADKYFVRLEEDIGKKTIALTNRGAVAGAISIKSDSPLVNISPATLVLPPLATTVITVQAAVTSIDQDQSFVLTVIGKSDNYSDHLIIRGVFEDEI